MPNAVPNQRLVAIRRERAAFDFLGIKNENWQSATRDLGVHALMLYLYLAPNANDSVPRRYSSGCWNGPIFTVTSL